MKQNACNKNLFHFLYFISTKITRGKIFPPTLFEKNDLMDEVGLFTFPGILCAEERCKWNTLTNTDYRSFTQVIKFLETKAQGNVCGKGTKTWARRVYLWWKVAQVPKGLNFLLSDSIIIFYSRRFTSDALAFWTASHSWEILVSDFLQINDFLSSEFVSVCFLTYLNTFWFWIPARFTQHVMAPHHICV